MICTRCGWHYNDQKDYYCSGCGNVLRGFSVKPKKEHYTLFYGSGASRLILDIQNPGSLPLVIDGWVTEGLKGLIIKMSEAAEPPVTIHGNDLVQLKVEWDGSQPPAAQNGILWIFSGIRPPLQLRIACSPVPYFLFSVNGQLVRNGSVQVITRTPSNPKLDLKIELSRSSDVSLTSFILCPVGFPQKSSPLPDGMVLPFTIVEGKPLEFRMLPDLNPSHNHSQKVSAEFLFEQCSPQCFTIEIFEDILITHAQSIYFTGENAFINGMPTPREFVVTIINSGGVVAEVLQVRSLDEWLEVTSNLDLRNLEPYGRTQAQFSAVADPVKLAGQVESVINGKLAVTLRGREEPSILNIGAEIRNPKALTYPLAIDFGNTSTCAAFIRTHDVVLSTLEKKYEKEYKELPTIIEFDSFSPEGTPETGENFRYGRWLETTRYAGSEKDGPNFFYRACSFKKQIGQDISIARMDRRNRRLRNLIVNELYRFYLKETLCRFELGSGATAAKVILTYPASFTNSQLKALRKNAEQALGLEVITELSEPEALSLHYLRERPLPEDDLLFAVFDFGGGTTDISIGKVCNDNGVRVVSIIISVGLDDLGGDILSFELAKDIYSTAETQFEGFEKLFPANFGDIFRISLAEREKLFNFISLMKLAEGLKTNEDNKLTNLLAAGQTNITVHDFYPRRGGSPELWITNYTLQDFRRVVTPQIEKGFKKIRSTFRHLAENDLLGAVNGDIGLLILGGNSSRLPIVREIAQGVLGLPNDRILFDPETAKVGVALGAAWYGNIRQDPDADLILKNPPHVKFPIGRITSGRFEVIFPAGSEFGVERQISFSLRSAEPTLRLFYNLDPAEINVQNNDKLCELGNYPLHKYKKPTEGQCTLNLKLVEDGVEVRQANRGMPEIITIEW